MEANRDGFDRWTDDERAEFNKDDAAPEEADEDEVARTAGGAKPGAHADDDPARPKDAAPEPDHDDEVEKASRAQLQQSRPTIFVSAARAWEAAKTAMAYLVKANLPVYARDGELVQPVTEEGRGHKGQLVKVTTLVSMDDIQMKSVLLEHIKWQHWNYVEAGPRNVGPGRDVPRMILAARGDWPFKQLKGLSTTPTLRPDGSLLSKPGYDPVTQMLLVDLPRMPPINLRPSRKEAEAALALLKELFEEFPFVNDASRSVSLSLLLSTIARGALVFVPLHLFQAPEAGSGKSYLVDIVSMISTGGPCPVLAATDDPKEFEKRLAAAMQSGQPLISLDNLNGILGSSLLCQAITQSPVQQRLLGKSVDRMITNRSLFTANGNHISIVDDLGRRTLMAQLDAHRKSPGSTPTGKTP